MKNQYPDWLRKAASKGGKAKSAAKTAAARANAKLGGRPRKPKRVARRANDQAHPQPGAAVVERNQNNQ